MPATPEPSCRYEPVTGDPPEDLRPGAEFVHRVRLDPALAQRLLDDYAPPHMRRPLNRRVVGHLVERITAETQDEDGYLRLEEVRVTRDGRTCAGQHLLHAVIESGVTVDGAVRHNCPDPSWWPNSVQGPIENGQ